MTKCILDKVPSINSLIRRMYKYCLEYWEGYLNGNSSTWKCFIFPSSLTLLFLACSEKEFELLFWSSKWLWGWKPWLKMAEQEEGAWGSADLVVLLYQLGLAFFLTSKRKTEKSKLSYCLSTVISSFYC